MPFQYDPRLRGSGYRDTTTGRVISLAQVREQVNVMIDAGEGVQAVLSEMVSTGTLGPNEWREALRQEIKDNYITQYLAGIGGREQMTPADWGSIGGMIGAQYRFLESFYEEVQTGNLAEGQILIRANMYINSSRDAYERALSRRAGDLGYTEHRVVLGEAEHCPDCLVIAGEGWKPVDEPFISPSTGEEFMPGNGSTVCLTNCKCHMEYR